MISSIIEIIFILLFFIAVQLLVFIRNKKAKLLILNLIPSLLLILPLFLSIKDTVLPFPEYIQNAGFLLYPFTFITVMSDFFPIDKKNHLFRSIVISLPFIFLFLVYDYISIILLMYILLFIFLFIAIDDRMLNKLEIIFIMILPSIALLIYYNLTHNKTLIITALLILCILLTLFVLYEYSRRLHFINLRLISINNLNKRLNQVITRLRQSNNTLKKIISQKDIELLQIARHASLAEVTTGIAHELAQPLTGIKCLSQNMIDDINYDDFDHMQAVSDLVKISSLVDRSSSIIDHIRTFSRKRGFSFQESDLNACILNAIELINNQMRNSGIDLIFVLDDSVPRIYGDNLSLEQLFINLILNSKDAIVSKMESTGNFSGVIKITTTFNDGIVKLIIEDNGSGIPEDIIPKIWTPFFTTKQKGKGTGIGLSLSHRIIKEHNADVSINSSGEGTIFTIIFPVDHPHPEELSQS